jgi:hypothetical protein
MGGGVAGTDVPLLFDVGEDGPTLGPPMYGSPSACVLLVVQPKAASNPTSTNKMLLINTLRMKSPFGSTARNRDY